jgi:hypothetical protein
MNINDEILARIKSTEELLDKVKDKTTYAYLEGCYSLKCDYEAINDLDNACHYADIVIDLLQHNKVEYRDNQETREKINKMWVTSYDTKARNGDFEAFCIALEWNRPIHKQFYLPRAKLLKKHGVIQGVQDLIDDKLDLLVLNLPPRIGKTTIGLFLQVMLGGMCPDESILGAGHSVGLIQSFYSEIMNIIEGEEYRYHEIFPNNKIANKSAEYLYIDLNKARRFHTYNYVSIEAGGTGKVQAERLLYCDDLVKDVEQANNPDRLEKLYYNYTGTIKDRKIQRLCKDGVYRPCPEIHINTPWSLHDVTSRVVENAKEDDMSRVRIISVPCYDENGESNFMYDYGKGFNAKYYRDMEIAEDPVIFSAKYLMQPVERDGLVFNKDNISFYNELPSGEPDRIIGYADVSHGGDDYFSLPIGYVYGNEVYIENILFRHKFGGDDYIRPLVKNILIDNKVSRCGVEKNNGGDYFATLMEQDLRENGYHCNITTHNAPTNKRKLDRILACQNEIKGIAIENKTYRLYFKNPDLTKGDKDYMDAMHNLYSWNQNPSMQNKQHDDFPDSLAGLITNVLGGNVSGKARINVSGDMLGI